MKLVVLSLLAVCAAAGAAQAQSKKKDWTPGQGIDWKSDWDAAVEEAAARNVPIHFAVRKDGDPAGKAMSEAAFADPKVIERSRNFVNVLAHSETAHGDHEIFVGREKTKLCNEYPNIPCSIHTKGWAAVTKFIQGNFTVPLTIFADLVKSPLQFFHSVLKFVSNSTELFLVLDARFLYFPFQSSQP